MSLLHFEHISKAFSGVEVLHDINLSIYKGQIVALLGENGAGKSTLMKILCGILTDYDGNIILNGQRIYFKNPRDAENAGISIIHQELNLVPDLSVAENIFLGREPVNKMDFIDYKTLEQNALKALSDFDFPYAVQQKIHHLPIGWQQMVEIAKALSINAEIIVMDEPTSALSDSEIDFLFEKIALLQQQGKTIIYISHRMKEIFAVADEVVILRDGYFVGQYPLNQVDSPLLIQKMIGKNIRETVQAPMIESQENAFSMKDVEVNGTDGAMLSNIRFDLKKGEVLGVAGLLGAGRTE
ncbi:MAG: ATP-binding cassette domain-containing protein, partial [Caldithrix sp.]|nr:ATP-binding cassette domain-containing protein [Caldithrix sp.]